MTNQEFTTPEDALAHFGVKGMKWGVRKARDDSDGGAAGGSADKAAAKALKKESAVIRQQGQEMARQILKQKVTTATIKEARGRVNAENKQFRGQVRAVKKGYGTRLEKKVAIEELRSEILRNPDRLIAARMTRGEKALAVATLATPLSAIGSSMISTQVGTQRALVKAAGKAAEKDYRESQS